MCYTKATKERKRGLPTDKRKHYILVLDTETANTLMSDDGKMDMSDVLVYDYGWAVVDKAGNIYETASYVNRDIFVYERDMMQSAYYHEKIPQYVADIRAGRRKMADLYEIRAALLDTLERWNIDTLAAYNARFDDNAMKRTQAWCTKSKYRYFLPFNGVVWWDIMKMANDVVCKMPTYKAWCVENGYLQKNGVPRKTAEMVYRFITGDHDFEESHTGLEDVTIEAAIMAYCFRQHKEMRKLLWENPREFPESTSFQIALLSSIKNQPTIRGAW